MTPKPPTGVRPHTHERRSGIDRRKVDVDRPGRKERRRAIDPRKPEVVELDMSNSEWTALSQSQAPPTKTR